MTENKCSDCFSHEIWHYDNKVGWFIYLLLCGCFKLCMNSEERIILSPLYFSHCLYIHKCVCVRARMHNLSEREHVHALTSMGCSSSVLSASKPLSFGKTSECSVLNTTAVFLRCVCLSLTFLLCF